MKTQFELVDSSGKNVVGGFLIVGKEPKSFPYVPIKLYGDKPHLHKHGFIKDKDLELFAVNILKALNSKRLLQGKIPYHKRKNHKS